MEDFIKFKGKLELVLRDENGNIKQVEETNNLVVTAGKAHITSRMIGVGQAVMSYMAVGTTATAPAAGDTDLIAIAGTRVSGATSAQYTQSVTNDGVQYQCTIPAGNGTGALVEAGIFNASSGVTMLARAVFSVINKAAGDSLTITWKVYLT